MSWFSELIHPGRAYKNAQNTLTETHNNAQGTRQPWVDQGQDQYKILMDAITNLSNPGKLQDEWSKGYKESDYAKQMEGMTNAAGMDSASANGLIGSSAAMNNLQNNSSRIINEDRDKYMKDMMEKYMAGIGLSGGIYGSGAGMAGKSADSEENYGTNKATLGFGGQTAGSSYMSSALGKLFNALMQRLGGGNVGKTTNV